MLQAYNFAIRCYGAAINMASYFLPKAKRWTLGRKNWRSNLDSKSSLLNDCYWFHCASLGEFEQARSVIEAIKEKEPERKILLTFFSPSGYEIRKNYRYADLVFYLPLDTPENAHDFLQKVNPAKVFFVKYEFWFNYLKELFRRKIPVYYFSVILRENHYLFKSFGSSLLSILKNCEKIFVQDRDTFDRLNAKGFDNLILAGDTRFDRVLELRNSTVRDETINVFRNQQFMIIAGSTWPKDEEALISALAESNVKIIIVPHEVEEEHLKNIESLCALNHLTSARLSKVSKTTKLTALNVLIVDSIGLLNKLYGIADLVYIGGGFGKGIHNILEAAVYGKPVIFGPTYKKFNEAVQLVEQKGAFPVASSNQLKSVLNELMNNPDRLKDAANVSAEFVVANSGATKKILNELY